MNRIKWTENEQNHVNLKWTESSELKMNRIKWTENEQNQVNLKWTESSELKMNRIKWNNKPNQVKKRKQLVCEAVELHARTRSHFTQRRKPDHMLSNVGHSRSNQ